MRGGWGVRLGVEPGVGLAVVVLSEVFVRASSAEVPVTGCMTRGRWCARARNGRECGSVTARGRAR